MLFIVLIDKVLKEQDFGAGSRVDASTAAKMQDPGGQAHRHRPGDGVHHRYQGRSTGGIGLKVSTARVALDGRLIDTTTEIITSVRGAGESKQSGSTFAVGNLPFIAFGAKDFRNRSSARPPRTPSPTSASS